MIILFMYVLINCIWNDDKLKFCIDVIEIFFVFVGFEYGFFSWFFSLVIIILCVIY